MSRYSGMLFLILFLTSTAIWAAEADADWVITCESNGFPTGDTTTDMTRQVLFLKGDRLKLQDLETKRFSIVRLDREVIWECDPGGPDGQKTYRETPFSSIRQARAEQDQRDRRQVERLKERLTGDELEEALAAMGLRADGKKVVETVRTGEEREIAGHPARQVQVLENGEVVFDLWVTPELERPTGLLTVYQSLGAFDENTMAQVQAVDGFPLAITAHFKLEGGVFELVMEAQRALERELQDRIFDLPEGYQRVTETTAEGMRCPVCGRPPSGEHRLPLGGEVHEFCSNTCLEEFLTRLLEDSKEE